MRLFKALFIILLISRLYAADDLGWQVGVGFVSSDLLSEQRDTPVFPYVRTDNKQWMMIPNLKWQGERWSFGADGIGYRYRFSDNLQLSSNAGFPSSRIGLSGQQGWFRYGSTLSASYGNGLTTTAGINAAGLSYERTLGWGERGNDLSQKLSFGAPVFIAKNSDLIVIGSAYLQRDNADFLVNDYQLSNQLRAQPYQHTGLSLFSVIPVSDQITVLLSGSLQWNDEDLTAQVAAAKARQFNTFVLLSYQL